MSNEGSTSTSDGAFTRDSDSRWLVCEPLDKTRKSPIDFSDIHLQQHKPMTYPTEVDLYSATISAEASAAMPTRSGTGDSIVAHTELSVPCGHFNIWRPLHTGDTPVAARFARFFPDLNYDKKVASSDDHTHVILPKTLQDSSQMADVGKWDCRISYSSSDDEYYQNGRVIPYVKEWSRGMLATNGMFRKVEHDWRMSYLAVNQRAERQGHSYAVWRFNFAASRKVISSFHAVLSTIKFHRDAAVQWYVRPLDQPKFTHIPDHILTESERAAAFPETYSEGEEPSKEAITDEREDVLRRYKGHVLTYMDSEDQFNNYIEQTVPGYAVDLSEYVGGEYGFEIAVALFSAKGVYDGWQKVQIARQSMMQPVTGRFNSPSEAMGRCGLDFRINLRDEISVDPIPSSLSGTQKEDSSVSNKRVFNDPDSDFTIYVSEDSEGNFGKESQMASIRAHLDILAAGSDYFAALLNSNMVEAADRQVVLENIPYKWVVVAIEYIYTDGEIDRLKLLTSNCDGNNGDKSNGTKRVDDLVALLHVASRLSIIQLFQNCQMLLLDEVYNSVYTNSSSELDRQFLAYETELVTINDAEDEVGIFGDSRNSFCVNVPSIADGHYSKLVEHPETEFINELIGIATECGAQQLVNALNRLLAYYPISVCEDRMRTKQYPEFIQRPRSDRLRIRRPRMHVPQPGANELEILDRRFFLPVHRTPMNNNNANDANERVGDDQLPNGMIPNIERMPGPVIHPQFVQYASAQITRPANPTRVQTEDNPGADEQPPEPQPGPIPEPPRPTD